MKKNLFNEHPNSVGMTYFQHLRFALMLACRTFGCALASLIHAFFPFLFVRHTSDTITSLYKLFEKRNLLKSGNRSQKSKDGRKKTDPLLARKKENNCVIL
jgi:hypothetical protein